MFKYPNYWDAFDFLLNSKIIPSFKGQSCKVQRFTVKSLTYGSDIFCTFHCKIILTH